MRPPTAVPPPCPRRRLAAAAAFADQTAEEVRDAVGEDEGIGNGGGPQQEGEALVADIAEDTADNGDQGDDGGRFKDVLFFGQAGVAPSLSH